MNEAEIRAALAKLDVAYEGIVEASTSLGVSAASVAAVALTLRAELAPPPSTEPPAPAPNPPTPPQQATSKYRCQQRHLFQRVEVSHIPGRLPGQGPLLVETSGPTATEVDGAIGWRWANKGGDFGPATATISANVYPRGSAGGWYSINARDALREALRQDRPWAFRLGSTVARRMHGRKGENPPVLVLMMADGSRVVVPCWVSSSASTFQPSQLGQTQAMPAFVEFDRPEVDPAIDEVVDARIDFFVSEHSGMSGSAAFTLHLLTPDITLPAPLGSGLAELYPGDVGIEDDPGVLWHHDYADDRPETDFIFRQPGLPTHVTNIESARNYSPDVFDLEAEPNIALYPYRGAGRWLGAGPNVSIVKSDYRGYGYKPFRPGYGALRVHLPREERAVEGGLVHNAGTLGSAMELPLPVPMIGRQQRMSVRYVFRWGVPDGEPFEMDLDWIKAVWQKQHADGTFYDPNWLSYGGKCGITPSHTNKAGGRSGSSGGGGGWQNRLLWGRFPTGSKGPQAHGITCGFHLFDYQGRNSPTGKGSLGSKLPWTAGKFGGVLYPKTDYTIEHRIVLNSVDKIGRVPVLDAEGKPTGEMQDHYINGVPQYWAEDGELTLLIDDMPAWHDTGLCFRSMPYRGMPRDWDPTKSSIMYQIGDLGVRSMELNVFSGGVTPGACDMSFFYSAMVVSLGDHIGPMRLV